MNDNKDKIGDINGCGCYSTKLQCSALKVIKVQKVNDRCKKLFTHKLSIEQSVCDQTDILEKLL